MVEMGVVAWLVLDVSFVEVVEDYSKAKQLTQLFSIKNNLLILSRKSF